jgi:hypothetical protein
MFRAKLTTAMVIGAVVWPAGAYAMTDPHPAVDPDAPSAQQVSTPKDLRSPDARDAALQAQASQSQDLRSPDARDAAGTASPAEITAARAQSPTAPAETPGVSPSRSAPSVSDGFEWGDAGIGAAIMLALVSLASGTVLLTGRSRGRAPTA